MARMNSDVRKGAKAANSKTKGGAVEKSMRMTKTPKMPKNPKGRV